MNMNNNFNFIPYTRFNISDSVSDIQCFVREYRERINEQLAIEEENSKNPFVSFADKRLSIPDVAWLKDNQERFLKDTENECDIKQDYLSACGFICSILYSEDGDFIVVGHSSGLIQMRHGSTGCVMTTLRNMQFPPKPIYALEFSKSDEYICYASCMDGCVYRIEIPQFSASVDNPPKYCIRVDPALECLTTQFYGTPGISSHSMPFASHRSAALSIGITADETRLAVGYADSSIKIYDMETQEVLITYNVHKLRLQFIPKKLQRMHFGQVCALKCHDDKHYMFASGAWDKTLRVWDIRCKVGCVMTFEGVNICSNSIDLNRDQCIAGSWQTTEALTVWDLIAKKKINVIRVQNRRPDVDGEYIYACKYWHSEDYNRKGKYAVIGGSGTKCLEVINLHNRYITCSYPANGTILAVTSHNDRIAFGGTATTFNIVKFHDPKHEKDKYYRDDEEFEYTKAMYADIDSDKVSNEYSSVIPNAKSSHSHHVASATLSKMSKM